MSSLGWVLLASGCGDTAGGARGDAGAELAAADGAVVDVCLGSACGAPDSAAPTLVATEPDATSATTFVDAADTLERNDEIVNGAHDIHKVQDTVAAEETAAAEETLAAEETVVTSEEIVGCVPQAATTRYDATWLFGAGCRADWDSANQLTLQTSSVRFLGFEGTITAADPTSGALFAASDGIYLYDGSGTQTNTALLGASATTSQAVAFIGRPGSESDFLLVANAASESGVGGLYVSTLSCGSVVPAGPPVLIDGTQTYTEALATIRHPNGTDRWIVSVAPEGIAAIPVTAAGLGSPVITAWNGVLSDVSPAQRASVAFARDRQTIAVTVEKRGLVLGHFDAASGTASDLAFIPLPPHTFLYSSAFSESGDRLYVSEWAGRLWQVDLANADVVTDLGAAGGGVRRAIDQRIYVAHNGSAQLTVITNPEAEAADLVLQTIQLPAGCASTYGFPGVGDL